MRKSILKLKLDLGILKLEIAGNNAEKCLHDINKMLERVNKITESGFDMIDYNLSDELVLNQKVMKKLNSFSQIYSNYKINRVAIENKKIVELEKGKVNTQLDTDEVKKNVRKLLFPVIQQEVKQVVAHIKGPIQGEEARKIIDIIEEELKGAEVHAIFSKGDISSHTIVECVFFGDFEEND